MIASQNKGRGFRGTLNYLLQKGQAEILDQNMAGRNERELAAEFGAARRLRPEVSRAVYHVSLSVREVERLSDAQWREAAQKYLKGMGFENNQYILLRHKDTPNHDHVHILANRIGLDGKVVSDSRDYDRSAQVVKGLEREYGLSRDAHRPYEPVRERPLTKGQGRELERTGAAPVQARLQELIKAAARDRPELGRFLDRLEAGRVNVRLNLATTGRVAGISYELDGVAFKGSQLGKRYAWDGLQKELGVNYEQSRDLARCRQAAERGKPVEPGRSVEQTRGINRDTGGEPGKAERGNESSLERTQGHEREPQGGIDQERGRPPDRPAGNDHGQQRDAERAGGLERPAGIVRERVRAKDQGELERSQEQALAGHDRLGGLDRSVGRVADLAMVGPAAGRDGERLPGGGEGRDRGAEPELHHPGEDHTREAVRTQLRAFGCERFDLGIRDGKSRPMTSRSWSREEVEQHLPWLKRQNALGHPIYVRPAEPAAGRERVPGIVLVDGLKRETVEQMKRDGLEPSLVVETGRGRHQAWVRVTEGEISRDEAREAARHLATRYGGARAAADERPYGRLAGFAKVRPERGREDGLQPLVLLREALQRIATKGAELLERVRAYLADREKERRIEHIRAYRPHPDWRREASPAELYRREAQRVLERPPRQADGSIDYGQVDRRVAEGLAEGRHGRELLREALREGSPVLAGRKTAELEDYLERTVTEALAARERSRERGFGLSHGR